MRRCASSRIRRWSCCRAARCARRCARAASRRSSPAASVGPTGWPTATTCPQRAPQRTASRASWRARRCSTFTVPFTACRLSAAHSRLYPTTSLSLYLIAHAARQEAPAQADESVRTTRATHSNRLASMNVCPIVICSLIYHLISAMVHPVQLQAIRMSVATVSGPRGVSLIS